ncbi:hypothetical protein BDY21DRAFT_352748 [Lineolata rhizophorae]|uniref:Uncharacterized protein n=1 Tax=Lineolata rhizophorae TaxID=578093 RepID=A0A6A6NRL7_9PEZI|nr:hypothetical protein BDY21DRAFT_352748 [Lineolata rhizophorae]
MYVPMYVLATIHSLVQIVACLGLDYRRLILALTVSFSPPRAAIVRHHKIALQAPFPQPDYLFLPYLGPAQLHALEERERARDVRLTNRSIARGAASAICCRFFFPFRGRAGPGATRMASATFIKSLALKR